MELHSYEFETLRMTLGKKNAKKLSDDEINASCSNRQKNKRKLYHLGI